jgi:RNA polymerase sigma factor (sigma-70 family)
MMHREPTDEELLVASKGDGDAFAEFYERHARSVLAYVSSRLGSVDLGAEATAETFARALEGIGRYRPSKGSPAAWLYGIARHEVARTLERGSVERRYRTRLGIADIHLDDDEIERLEGLVAQEKTRQALGPLLAELPSDQRESLEARIVHDRSYQAIADEAGTTSAAARKRVSRALSSLRAKLGTDT